MEDMIESPVLVTERSCQFWKDYIKRILNEVSNWDYDIGGNALDW